MHLAFQLQIVPDKSLLPVISNKLHETHVRYSKDCAIVVLRIRIVLMLEFGTLMLILSAEATTHETVENMLKLNSGSQEFVSQ